MGGPAAPAPGFPAAYVTRGKPPADRAFTSQVFMYADPQLAEPDEDGEESSTRIGPREFVALSTTVSWVPGKYFATICSPVSGGPDAPVAQPWAPYWLIPTPWPKPLP